MDLTDKRNFINTNLNRVNEPAIDELYNKMVDLLNDSLIEESEEDIKAGNLTSHETLKKEISNWRPTK